MKILFKTQRSSYSELKVAAGLFLAIVVLVSMVLPSQAQQISDNSKPEIFALLRNAKPIGEVSASYTTKNGHHFYELNSAVQVRILVKITVNIRYIEEFDEDHILVKSSYHQSFNGFNQKDIKVNRVKDSYQITSGDKLIRSEKGNIFHTALKMYFEEPENLQKVFSENQKKYVSIRGQGRGVYMLIQENGETARYTYTGQRLIQLESSSKHGTISIIRKNQENYAIR